MFCKNCGKEIDDNAYVCPNCGVKGEKEADNAPVVDPDSGNKGGWGFLSFLFPVVGLILFIVWRHTRPKTSKVCGICALVSAILYVLGIIICVVILVAVVGALGNAANSMALSLLLL